MRALRPLRSATTGKENPGSTAEQHQFPSAFINMLIGNLNISCSAEEMLVIINTNQQDIESVAAFIKTRINSIMASGLSEEELIGEEKRHSCGAIMSIP